MTPERRKPSHIVPRTIWEKLYVGLLVVCFLMVWLGTWAVNEPVAILGLPLVYIWCTAWGVICLFGCLVFGLKMERDREQARRT